MVEGARLESVYTVTRIVSSNLIPSARPLQGSFLNGLQVVVKCQAYVEVWEISCVPRYAL